VSNGPLHEDDENESPLAWLSIHWGLAAAIFTTLLFVTKVLVVSGLNADTAYTIISQGASVSAAIGILVSTLPGLALGILFVSVVSLVGGIVRGTRNLAFWFGAVVLSSIVCFYLVPLNFFAFRNRGGVVVAGIALICAIPILWRIARVGKLLAVAGLIGLFAATAVTSTVPWLPPEIVVFSTGSSGGYVGYVLHSDSQNTVFLREAPRIAEIYPTNSIVSQSYCSFSNGNRSLWQVVHKNDFDAAEPRSCDSEALATNFYIQLCGPLESWANCISNANPGIDVTNAKDPVQVNVNQHIVMNLVVWNDGDQEMRHILENQSVPTGLTLLFNSSHSITHVNDHLASESVGEGIEPFVQYTVNPDPAGTRLTLTACASTVGDRSCETGHLVVRN
jgi:hypothetical protein